MSMEEITLRSRLKDSAAYIEIIKKWYSEYGTERVIEVYAARFGERPSGKLTVNMAHSVKVKLSDTGRARVRETRPGAGPTLTKEQSEYLEELVEKHYLKHTASWIIDKFSDRHGFQVSEPLVRYWAAKKGIRKRRKARLGAQENQTPEMSELQRFALCGHR